MWVISRIEDIYSLPLQVLQNQTLSIVVENQGRICFGADLADRKGILGNVTLGNKEELAKGSTFIFLISNHKSMQPFAHL